MNVHLSTRDTDRVADEFANGLIDCIYWCLENQADEHFARKASDFAVERSDIIEETDDLLTVVYNFGWCVMFDFVLCRLRYSPLS